MSPSQRFLAWLLLTLSTPLIGQDFVTQESSQVLLQLPPDIHHRRVSITEIDFSPNGESIAIGASDGTVRNLPISEGSVPQMIANFDNPVRSVTFSPDANQVASAAHLRVIVTALKNAAKSPTLERLPIQRGRRCIKFSPDGKSLAVGSNRDSSTVVDLETAKVCFAMNPFAGVGSVDTALYNPSTEAMDFSPDGKLLAVSSYFWDDELPSFRNVQVWDTSSGKLKFFFRGGYGEFSPDGKLLAYRNYTYGDGRIVFLDLETFLIVGALTGSYHHGHFSPDGRSMAAISKQTLEIWTIAPSENGKRYDCKHVASLKHKTDLTSFAFSPDGHSIVTGDKQGTIRLWRIDD